MPFIAETGGINAMIVDSSALPEQVVTDVLTGAFGSAGQRCSALRLLCLQDDIADRVLHMLRGAAETLVIGDPLDPATDVGPVIDEEARASLARASGKFSEPLFVLALPPAPSTARSSPRAPICLDSASELTAEIFGPVLCIVRYAADRLDELLDAIDATGFGLTLGIHSRIEIDATAHCGATAHWQYIRQPQPDRRRGRRAAVRWTRPVRHRAQGRKSDHAVSICRGARRIHQHGSGGRQCGTARVGRSIGGSVHDWR